MRHTEKGEQIHDTQEGDDMEINFGHELAIGRTRRTNQLKVICMNSVASAIGPLRVIVGHGRLVAVFFLSVVESHDCCTSFSLGACGRLAFCMERPRPTDKAEKE
jgi:hypothetical protein